jgi:adenylate cyclase
LLYLAEFERSGQAGAPDQVAIATEILGRGAGFDPKVDSIVRVEIGRLRRTLDRFYAKAGASDDVQLCIPGGTSRLGLTVPAPGPAAQETAPDRPRLGFGAGLWAGVLATFAVGILAALAGWSLWQPTPDTTRLASRPAKLSPPVIEVRPFQSPGNNDLGSYLAAGLQASLVRGLSNFKTIRVRNGVGAAADNPDRTRADYTLEGLVTGPVATPSLELSLTDAASGDVLWATNMDAAPADEGLALELQQRITEVVVRIAAPGGIVQQETLARSRNLEALAADSDSAAFLCNLHWYAFDTTKDPEHERAARTCLNTLVAGGTKDGQTWAAYGFLTFLDWTKTGAGADDPLMQKAENAARRAVALAPHNADAHEYLGSILLSQGAYAAATFSYETAYSLNPSKPDLLVLLGWQRAQGGDWDGGIPIVQSGVDLAPSVPGWFRIPLALNAFRQGDYARSLAEAEKMLISGDTRGRILAVPAASKLNDADRLTRLRDEIAADGLSLIDALNEVRAVFNNDEVFALYEAEIALVPRD